MATEAEFRSLAPAEELHHSPDRESTVTSEASDSALFDIYQKMVESRAGALDARIFQKLREWYFSDFSLQPHEFAGVSKAEFDAWPRRHRINLSGGCILTDPVDLQRGYAWGHLRIVASVNYLRSEAPPPN